MIYSIVIPCKTISDSLLRLLGSCKEQDFVQDKLEMIVVYNQDGLGLDATTLPDNVRLIKTPQISVSHARNLGAEKSSGTYLLFLDDDTWLEKKTHLSDLYRRLTVLSEEYLIGGGYQNAPQCRHLTKASNFIANLWLISGLTDTSKNEGLFGSHLLGGNMCLRNSFFQKLKFPEDIRWGGEDSVFAANAISVGGKIIFDPQFNVFHDSKTGLKKFAVRSWLSGRTFIQWALPNTNSKNKIKALLAAASREIFLFAPALLMHLLILESSRLFYRFRKHTLRDS